jgi:membrane protein DedA with SNARE-associated domain
VARSIGLIFLAIHVHFHFIHRGVPAPSIDYAALAIGSFASWAGVPGPGEPLLIAAAIVAAKHKLDLTPVLAWAFVGASAGGIVGWLGGLYAGRTVMTAPGPLRKLRLKAVERGEEVFARFTVIAILVTPAWVAGIHRVGAVVYLITNEVSALVWAVGIGVAAYYVGPPVLDVLSDIGWISVVGIGVLLAAGILFEVRRRRRGSREPAG